MKGVPPLGGGAPESQGGPSPDELAEPLHEWEAGRWAALVTDAPQSLGFAFGASEDVLEQVLRRVRQLAGAAVERVHAGRAGAWSAVVSALRTLPAGGALVVDLGRAEDEEPWSALDWQGLNLARDSRERTDRHVLFWVRGFDGVEELRDGAADLWALRSIVLQFPSMADFDRVKGPVEEAPLEGLRRNFRSLSPDLERASYLFTRACHSPSATTALIPAVLRVLLVLRGNTTFNQLRALAGLAGGLSARRAVAARALLDAGRWPVATDIVEGNLIEVRRVGDLDPDSRWRAVVSAALLPGRPRQVQLKFGSPTLPRTAPAFGVGLRVALDVAGAKMLLSDGILRSGGNAVGQALTESTYNAGSALPLLDALWDAGLCSTAAALVARYRGFDPSLAAHRAARVSSDPTLGARIERRRVGVRDMSCSSLHRARALRNQATPEERAAALEALVFTEDPPVRAPLLAPLDEIRALSAVSEDPIEAALAVLRDFVGPELSQPAPLGLDRLRLDPLADLRVEGWVLTASLLRELGRPADALVPIERALAHSYLCDVRQIALSELECARIHAALGDADRAVEHLDRVEYVLADEQDDEWDLRPLTTLVSAGVLRARLTRRAEPLTEVADLCTREENRRLLFELELERAGSTWMDESDRVAAARRALSMAREAGYLLLEARASAWCAHFGGPDAAALRARADWVAARCASPELSAALNAILIEDL